MRSLVFAVIVFIALIGFGIYNYYYFERTAGALVSEIDKIELNLEEKNWSKAEAAFDRMSETWSETHSEWTSLIDHHELDTINITMARAKKFMDTRNLPGSMSEFAQLKLLFNHIPEKEALNLKNIL